MVDPGTTQCEKTDFTPEICDRNGIPFLSRREIESAAVGFLWEHCPWVLAAPKATPVLDILDQLKLRTGLSAKFVELGHKGTAKIVGRLSFRNRLLHLDYSVAQDAGFRFALAYEIGHWVLHRDNFDRWDSPDLDTHENTVENPLDGLFPFRRRTPAESLEYQARTFAAELIMPCRTFTSAFSQLRQEFGFSIESARGNLEKMVFCLGDTFRVSKMCICIRIKELQLLAHGVCESFADVSHGEHEPAPVERPSFSPA